MQTDPFHARELTNPAENFWHDNDMCHLGRCIVPANRQPGIQLASKHCPCCAQLNEPLCTPCALHVGVQVLLVPHGCRVVAQAARPAYRLTAPL